MPAKAPQMYAVTFTAADGDHLASLTLTKCDDQSAMRHANHIFGKFTLKLVLPVSGPDEIQKMKVDLMRANPARVPIDELTAGEPNRVIHDPSLLEPDDE